MQPSRTVLIDLPSYLWHYENNYWNESRLSKAYRLREHNHHDLLGSRVSVASDFRPAWRNILKLETVPWIRDHQIQSDIVFPGAAYIAMVGEAIRQLEVSEDFTVRNSAMVFQESKDIETIVTLEPSHLTVAIDFA